MFHHLVSNSISHNLNPNFPANINVRTMTSGSGVSNGNGDNGGARTMSQEDALVAQKYL